MVKGGTVRSHTDLFPHHPVSLQPRQAFLDLPTLFPKTSIFGWAVQDRGGQDPGQTLTEDLRNPKSGLGIPPKAMYPFTRTGAAKFWVLPPQLGLSSHSLLLVLKPLVHIPSLEPGAYLPPWLLALRKAVP